MDITRRDAIAIGAAYLGAAIAALAWDSTHNKRESPSESADGEEKRPHRSGSGRERP